MFWLTFGVSFVKNALAGRLMLVFIMAKNAPRGTGSLVFAVHGAGRLVLRITGCLLILAAHADDRLYTMIHVAIFGG